MARRQTPQQWQELMERAGLSSIRRLAERAGMSQSTASRTVHGDHIPGDETVNALANALRVPAKDIYKLTHGHDIQARPWTPPAEVQRLSKREQDALTEMIRAMAAGRDQDEEVVEDEHDSAPMNQADQPSATDYADRYGLAAHPEEDIPGDAEPAEGP